jgi:hypothetical protein
MSRRSSENQSCFESVGEEPRLLCLRCGVIAKEETDAHGCESGSLGISAFLLMRKMQERSV